MAEFHLIKNTSSDKPGYLIDKFDSSGRIIITVYTDVFSHKISFRLQMNTKDLFEHLLKPTSPFPMVSINGKIENDTNVIFFPAVFPNGVVESLTMLSNDYDKIESFSIACYGNDENIITGAKQWFYATSDSMIYDGESSFKFKNGNYPSIVPYSYNFVAFKVKFKSGGYLLANTVDDDARARLLALDAQWGSDVDLSTLTTIDSSINKTEVASVPFIQFNLLKAN